MLPRRACPPSLVAGALAIVAILAGGCGDDLPTLDEGTSSSSGGESSDDAAYDFARLEISEPESASIHPLGEPVHLLAQVTDPAGIALHVDDVAWVTEGETTLLDTLEGDVELPAGLYELTAVAKLPNGDRLQTAVGGVRVQARWTGAYAGELVLLVEAEIPGGGPLTLRCEGPLEFVVSLDGRDAPVEDGACTISVLGQSFDATYAVDMVIYPAGLVRGTVAFAFDTPLGAFDLPLEWAGAFYDDTFSAGLSGTADLPLVGASDVSGYLRAPLIDRYVEPDGG
jgi:hypothetical protein